MLGDYTKSADDQVSRDKRHWFLTFCFKYLHLEIVIPNILGALFRRKYKYYI